MDIGMSALILFSTFMALLFIGVPISICIAVSSIAAAMGVVGWDQITFLAMQKMNGGIESFSLLAVPLFILAGNIMNNGGIARLLIDFAKLFVGRVPGSLAQTNVLGNMFFGSLAGSAVAASAAIGGTLAPIQRKEGYDMGFATAVNIASAPTGLLIPPTAAFIVYSAVVGGVSISALFMAGYVPGILMGLSTMILAWLYARRHKYPVSASVPAAEALRITLKALPSLLLIIIVIGGIVGGIFTATEGAGVCVVYCLFLAICYKAITVRSFMRILLDSACVSGIVLFLISCSSAMSYVMAFSGIPAAISQYILGLTDNPILILLLINVILLVVGTFMDITPAILIFTPIFLPIATSLGMTPVQFGVVLIFNMCLGCMTPPVGSVLFVSCGVTGISIEKVIRPLLPYVAMLFLILLLVTYVPWISIGIPTMMGLM
ncbi:MAG: TRAP transporter large permease [Succinivibrionaceae bacterium]|nr:TRAP transporter large permease [Succinivibrionaceae bacterium]